MMMMVVVSKWGSTEWLLGNAYHRQADKEASRNVTFNFPLFYGCLNTVETCLEMLPLTLDQRSIWLENVEFSTSAMGQMLKGV